MKEVRSVFNNKIGIALGMTWTGGDEDIEVEFLVDFLVEIIWLDGDEDVEVVFLVEMIWMDGDEDEVELLILVSP